MLRRSAEDFVLMRSRELLEAPLIISGCQPFEPVFIIPERNYMNVPVRGELTYRCIRKLLTLLKNILFDNILHKNHEVIHFNLLHRPLKNQNFIQNNQKYYSYYYIIFSICVK